VCTVVTRCVAGEPLQILAVRDELVSRAFDEPGEWWPEHPGVIGGRDRSAGGSWCVSDVAAGTTALLVNRIERREGTPTRGLLPLAAVADGEAWTAQVDHRTMAAFNLVLAGSSGVTVWTWDATQLRRVDLPPGVHMITSRGVDTDDDKTTQFSGRFAVENWYTLVTSCEPLPDPAALVVRVPIEQDVYATVFGQLITAAPGALHIDYSRTPWLDGTWTGRDWP
jgi:uncharacterized protein with NRDE domain